MSPSAVLRSRHPRVALLVVVMLALLTATAAAYWTTIGTGSGAAAAGTLGAPPSATASVASGSRDVTVAWTAPAVPSGAVVSGFYVTRILSGVPDDACGSDVDNLLPATPLTCVDTAVANGTYTYTVTAVLGGWEATSPASNAVTVVGDVNSPTMTLAGTSLVNAYLGPNGANYRLYYRSSAVGGGSIRIAASVTDAGSGPKQVVFPAIATTGWTHAAETVTTGTGALPTLTYTSSPFTFVQNATTPGTRTITGSDVDGNVITKTVTFRRDNSLPTGGTLVVNGATGTTAGVTSTSSTGSYSITTLTQFTETQSTTQSGLASSSLVRDQTTYAGGVCGTTFSGAVTLTGPAPVTQTGLAAACYRYRLTGTDNVGNVATRTVTVLVDPTAPVGGALTANGVAATAAGSTSSNGSGSWTLTRTDFTDPESGIASSTLLRSVAPVTNGACGAFGAGVVVAGAPAEVNQTVRQCYRYVLTGTNGLGLTASLSTTVVVGPFASSVVLANGAGVAGQATAGDTVTITFSDPITPSSICSAWSGAGNQSLVADNQVTVFVNQVTGGDTLTVSSTACTLNVGPIALGSTGYTTATAAFGGAGAARSTVTWTAASRTLTITLGATGSAALAPVASSIATYTPSASILDTSGVALGGTFATANIRQL